MHKSTDSETLDATAWPSSPRLPHHQVSTVVVASAIVSADRWNAAYASRYLPPRALEVKKWDTDRAAGGVKGTSEDRFVTHVHRLNGVLYACKCKQENCSARKVSSGCPNRNNISGNNNRRVDRPNMISSFQYTLDYETRNWKKRKHITTPITEACVQHTFSSLQAHACDTHLHLHWDRYMRVTHTFTFTGTDTRV